MRDFFMRYAIVRAYLRQRLARRIGRIDIELAGLRAKQKAQYYVIELKASGSVIPDYVVQQLLEIPQRIAELEERRQQQIVKGQYP